MGRGAAWRRGVLVVSSLWVAACSGNEAGPPPAPGRPLEGPHVPPPWSFDAGKLPDGFETSEDMKAPVACSHLRTDEPGFERGDIEQVGGDYWKTVAPRGSAGLCWMRTGRAPTGTITSSLFRPAPRWLSFVVKRAPGSKTAVELHEGDRVVARTTAEIGGPRFVPVVWDMDELFVDRKSDRRVRIVVRDDEPARSIEASDFALSEKKPVATTSVDPRDKIWGFADLHAHFFSPMAFGGQLFWGNIHSAMTPQGFGGTSAPSDPKEAMKECTAMHGTGPNGGVLFTMPPEGGHSRTGYPEFMGFSNFQTVYHQQAYVEWLRRAWQGGLRLVQADAVNYQFLQVVHKLATLYHIDLPANPSGDEWNIREQVKAARAFLDLPDVKTFAGVALSATEARSLGQDGKLAVVLGTEVETFGGLDKKLTGMTDETKIRGLVQPYLGCLRERGVRHVIAVHLGENAFGSPAVYDVMFDLGNSAMRKTHFQLRATKPEERIFYSQDADWKDQSAAEKFIVELGVAGMSPPPPGPTGGAGQANKNGLTVAGRVLVQEMMRLGMVIDIDHMSSLAEDEVLTMAEKFHYPVIASHTGFRDALLAPDQAAQPQSWSSERSKSKGQVERIRALGGLVGVGTSRGPTRDSAGLSACDGSTPSFVTQVRYAISAMGGSGVAFGSDINGLGQQDAPRFGPYACWTAGEDNRRVNLLKGQRDSQSGGVSYDAKTPLRRHDWDRFSGGGKSQKDTKGQEMFLSQDERYAWQAAARYLAGDGEKMGGLRDRDSKTTQKYARGFWVAKTTGTLEGSDARDKDISGAFWGCKRSAIVCLGKADSGTEPRLTGDVAKTAAMIAEMWTSWGKMAGKNTPLTRSSLGEADFDINIDGLAHYGMLPDLLQDAKNMGLTEDEISVLFQGAESFVAMWEKAEAAAQVVNKQLPPSVCDSDPRRCTCGVSAVDAADPDLDPALLVSTKPAKGKGTSPPRKP